MFETFPKELQSLYDSLKEYHGHRFVDLLECVKKREVLKTDLQDLKSSILIELKDYASRIRNQKANFDKTLGELTKSIDEYV